MNAKTHHIFTSLYRYSFTSAEKDDETKGNGNSLNYGERMLDPRIGRWLSLDPLKSMYPSMSPYCYAGNTPIAAYDPDGRLIIFVNGYTDGPGRLGCKPLRAYWSTVIKGKGTFISRAANHFGKNGKSDNNHKFVDGNMSASKTALDRYNAGKAEVQKNEKYYRELIQKAIDNGEEIHFVSHSMGAAHAEGMIAAITEMGFSVEDVIHFSPADATDIDISAAPNVDRTQIGASGDLTLLVRDGIYANARIPGVTNYAIVDWNLKQYHPNYEGWWPFDPHFDTKGPLAWDWLEDFEQSELIDTGEKRTRTEYDTPGIAMGTVETQYERKVYYMFHVGDTRFTDFMKNGIGSYNDGGYSNRSDKYIGKETKSTPRF